MERPIGSYLLAILFSAFVIQYLTPSSVFFFLIWKLMPLVIQLKYCPVLPSLNKVDYYCYDDDDNDDRDDGDD